MSSYIDHHEAPRYIKGRAPDRGVTHSWDAHTHRAMVWRHGPNYATERASQMDADLAAWRALGRNRPQNCVDSGHIHTPPSANETRIGGDSAA